MIVQPGMNYPRYCKAGSARGHVQAVSSAELVYMLAIKIRYAPGDQVLFYEFFAKQGTIKGQNASLNVIYS